MANNWVNTVPAGPVKNNKLSDSLVEAAVAKSVLFDHANLIPFGEHSGDTITLERMANLTDKKSYVLSELDRVPVQDISLTTVSGTLDEIGNAIRYTNLLTQLNVFDMKQPIQRALRKQLTKAIDSLIATAFKAGQLKYSVTGATTGVLQTGGTFTTTSTAALKVQHVTELYDLMYDTYNAEPVDGENYFGVFRHASISSVDSDPDFKDFYKYTTPDKAEKQEIGKLKGIRMIDTNHSGAFGNVGTGSILGEGVVFGAEALNLAVLRQPELVLGNDDDFHRQQAVAWLGQLKAFLTWGDSNTVGEANVIHVGSA